MAITNRLIVSRFLEGMSLQQICAKYVLAEWEVEQALRSAIVRDAQKEIDFISPQVPDPNQLSIEEVYGSIKV